jgi:type IV secretion system protein VirB8
MARYFLRQYILYREGFDSDNLEYPYQIAWAMSSDSVRLQYDREVDSCSPRSAISRYRKDHFVTVEILSVSRLNANTAEVRFKKILQNRPLTKREIAYQAAIIKWDYVKPETTQKMLDRNPLGFKVTYYKTSEIESDNAS